MGSLRDRRVTVLGAGGFIGTHLCNALAREGARVRAFGRSRIDAAAMDDRVEWRPGELAEALKERAFLSGTEVVVHLACTTTPALSEADPAGDVVDNVAPAIRLMEAAAREGVGRLVFLSSGGTVYGVPSAVPIAETAPAEPISAHGLQKLSIERYLDLFGRTRGLGSIVLRVSNPYGPLQRRRKSQAVVAAFIEAGLRGEALEIWGDGTVVRDFVFIDDVVEAIIFAASKETRSRVFNLGSGRGLAIETVAADVEEALGRGPLPRIHHAARPADVPINILDVSRIRAELGWSPRTSWTEGLRRTINWMRGERP